jgi:mono/diheme cytochrome c family protein
VACHGDTGTGGHGGGASLVNMAKDTQQLAATAHDGRKTMPAFSSVLKPEQLRDVAGYVSQQLFGGAR